MPDKEINTPNDKSYYYRYAMNERDEIDFVITISLFKLISRIQVNTFHVNIILSIFPLFAYAAPDTVLWWMSLCLHENFDTSFSSDLSKPCRCR